MIIDNKYTLKDIASITGGKCYGESNKIINHIYYDTRLYIENNGHLFIAIKTLKNDGNKYIQMAYKKGVRLFLVQKQPSKILPEASYLLVENTICTIPYTRPKNEYIDSVITKSRNSSGVKMVNIDSVGIKEILSTLRNGNVVAFASDQVPKKGSGIFSSFFNQDIYSIKLVPKLQQKTSCAVHLMYCERKKNGEGFLIHFSDSIHLSEEVKEGVDKMNIEFEKCIMYNPGQYSWEYKKFKRTEKESLYL